MNYANLLIIEDEPLTSTLYKTLLEREGYSVWVAPSTQDAMPILEGEDIQVVLLDYNLPDQNGVEWLSELRHDNRFGELPVILVSGITRDDDLSQDKYVWFMEKPRHAEHIVVAVQSTIEQYGA